MIINTSFSVRGEPIVCDPEDAFRSFMGTEIDYHCQSMRELVDTRSVWSGRRLVHLDQQLTLWRRAREPHNFTLMPDFSDQKPIDFR